jgi:hypothetical protein
MTEERQDWRALREELATQKDPAQRTKVISHLRRMLEEEKTNPQSPDNKALLRVAEAIFDFIEAARWPGNGVAKKRSL